MTSSTGLTACSAFTILNATSPSKHYHQNADIRYGPAERQRLDVYVPADGAAQALVVFFYGGGWTEGSKKNYRFVASALTRAGFAVVLPDYRLHPEVRFPAFVEDGAAAVAKVLAEPSDYGIPSRPVFLMGHSAGAHIAAMLAYDERYLNAAGIQSARIDGFVGLSGPYDFLPIDSGYLEDVFPPANRDESQPVRYADENSPPSLLIHGTDDDRVYPSNSESLAARLQQAGVTVEYRRYEGVGHARTVVALAPPFSFLANTLEDTKAFVRRIIAAGRGVGEKGRPAAVSGGTR